MYTSLFMPVCYRQFISEFQNRRFFSTGYTFFKKQYYYLILKPCALSGVRQSGKYKQKNVSDMKFLIIKCVTSHLSHRQTAVKKISNRNLLRNAIY